MHIDSDSPLHAGRTRRGAVYTYGCTAVVLGTVYGSRVSVCVLCTGVPYVLAELEFLAFLYRLPYTDP